MGDYGYYGENREKRKRNVKRPSSKKKLRPNSTHTVKTGKNSVRAGRLLKVVDILLLCISALCSFVVLMAVFAKYINPVSALLPAFAALVFPVAYCVHMVLTLYWIVRWRVVYMSVMGIVLISGLSSISLFVRPVIKHAYMEDRASKGDIKIMTFNVMGFGMKVPDSLGRSTIEIISAFIADNDVNILCLQEYLDSAENRAVTDSLLEYMPYSLRVSYGVDRDPKAYQGLGHAIYSKFPIIRDGTVDVDSTHVRSVWADMRIKGDTIRIISNHLQNTSLSGDDRDFLMSTRVIRDSNNEKKIKDIVRKLRNNYVKRAPQAELIARFRDESPYRTIICGDFNDTPLSYVYRTIGNDMTDAFVAKGRGMSSTYHGLFEMFRIDYIFFSDGFTVKAFNNYDVSYSDHTPISAVFEISERGTEP